jgi:PAS domain S-box-containing protein
MPKKPAYEELERRVRELGKEAVERKQAEERHRENEQRMKLALDGTGDGIWDWNVGTGKITLDDNWARILGYEPGEMEFDFNWWEKSIHPESAPVFEEALNTYLEGRKKYYEIEYRIQTKSGKWKWIWARGKCVKYDEQGRPLRMIGTHSDITERKRLEEALQKVHEELEQRVEERTAELSKVNKQLKREIEERKQAEEELKKYQEIVSKMNDGFVIINPQGTLLEINDYFTRMTGWTREDLIGTRPPFKFWRKKDVPRIMETFSDLQDEGQSVNAFEQILQKKDGGEAPGLVNSTILYDKNGNQKAFFGIFRDITDIKQVEEALRKESHDLGERVKELDCLYGISNLVEKHGISMEEIFQGTVNLVPHSWQYPEITCARITMEGQIFQTNNFEETIWMQAMDIIVHRERIGTLEVCYLEEKPESNEGPFLKEERDLINAIAERLARIIERNQAEEALRDAQEEMMVKEKLATIGELSGGIAHELRNPLGVIDSSTYYLKKKLKEADEKVQEHLDRIKSQVGSAVAIIDSLLNLTRIKEPRLKTLDLRAITSEGISTSKVPDTINVTRCFPEEGVLVCVDREQLDLALRNIVTNGIEAMDGEGRLTVTISRLSDDRAELSFADTGPGIDPENLERIFQPLFSTKAKGIGFGLSIAKMIIDKHAGTIEAGSETGKGATITVRLPLYVNRGKKE